MKIVPTWCQPAAPRLRINLNTRRNCGFFVVTPSGIEVGPNVTETRRRTGASTEAGAVERPAAMSECNECNEALTAARRLALVAENAVANGDLRRAQAALRNLVDATVGSERNAARNPNPAAV